ncbi:MAG: transketolase C-terminal domain-containing protein, partial [Anaerovorax sp.]
RGGGNGDYHLIVLAPSSIQEAVNMMNEAFSIADEYRNPVMVLADGVIGQMMEPVVLPEMKEEAQSVEKPWALTGHENKRQHNVVKSLYLQSELLSEKIIKRQEKYERAKRELVKYETFGLEGADVVLVAFGISSRIAKDAIELLAEEGMKVGMIRPISLWPFPHEAFDQIDPCTKVVISVELNMGQMIDDVKIACHGRFPVSLVGKAGG